MISRAVALDGRCKVTDQELSEAFGALRPLCWNVIGFHQLAEEGGETLHPVKRLQYEAHVAASAQQLAMTVLRIGEALSRR